MVVAIFDARPAKHHAGSGSPLVRAALATGVHVELAEREAMTARVSVVGAALLGLLLVPTAAPLL